MRIVIIGAAGLVGQNLIRYLHTNSKLSYNIVAIDKDGHRIRLLKPYATCVVADVSKKGHWESLIKKNDIVIQLQAQISAPSKQPYIDNNITAINLVTQRCKKVKIAHLIHLSSSVVISVSNDNYTQTKKIGEKHVVKSSIPYTVLRPPLMYGWFDYKHLGFITNIMEIFPIIPLPGNGKYIRQPLFVMDLCRIINTCIKHGPYNEVFTIIGKEKIMFKSLLTTICKKRKMKRIFIPIPLKLFHIMLTTYNTLTKNKTFVHDQLNALVAGDKFPVSDWENVFNVKYTNFSDAWDTIISSPLYEFRSGHK